MLYLGFFFDIFFNLFVSLGVGTSTVALTLYLVSLKDSTIDGGERKALHIVYTILRVVMGAILLMFATFSILLAIYGQAALLLQPEILFIWLLIAVLFINAFLMTKHLMPMKVGPALQGATWYALGFSNVLAAFSLSFIEHVFYYVGWALVVILVVETIRRIILRSTPSAV